MSGRVVVDFRRKGRGYGEDEGEQDESFPTT
jgi:hypothetical protein